MALIPFLTLILCFNSIYASDEETCGKSSKQIHHRLKYDLLCDYDPTLRPRVNHKEAIKVTIRMMIQSFRYDMHSNTLVMNSWLPTKWFDDHLRWNESDYDGVHYTHFKANEIWTPDLSLINRDDQEHVQKILNTATDCVVQSTGEVYCVPPAKHAALCVADLRKFPFDVQKCNLWVSSWVHLGEEIDIRFAEPAITQENLQESAWSLLKTGASRDPGIYQCCPNDTYPVLGFNFEIQRNPSIYVATILAPSIVILIINLLVLWINVSRDVRIYLVSLNILFHILFIGLLSLQLPSVSDKPPNILIFAGYSLILCMIELIVTLALNNLIKSPLIKYGWSALIIDYVIGSKVADVLLFFDRSLQTTVMMNGASTDGSNLIEKSQMQSVEKLLFVKLVDRLIWIVLVMIYISMFLKFMS